MAVPQPIPQDTLAAEALDERGTELRTGFVRVRFGDGVHGDFHLRWLRHRCDEDRHPSTGERTVCSSDLPDRLSVEALRTARDHLYVRWAHDGRESRYGGRFLRRFAYALDREVVPRPPARTDDVRIERAGRRPGALVAEVLARVRAHGAAWVAGAGEAAPQGETELLIDALASAGLSVRSTHFGRIEDLRTDNTTNANNDQLGYTDAAIDVHTDQPFIERPPRYQLLQCLRAAEEGGETALVDARAAAAYLASIDAPAEALLRDTAVDFHRRQKAFDSSVVSPILTGHGDGFRIRYSYFTIDPFAMPFAQMDAYYRAYDRFARLVRDPRHQRRFTLAPGDFLFYDNHRMLHARTGFRGGRWLRGVYFDPRPAAVDDLRDGAY